MTTIPHEFRLASYREGWAIFECESDNGRWQVCKLDDPAAWIDPAPPALRLDSDAWVIVMLGTAPHHVHARDFIKAHNPQEWQAMVSYVAKGTP